MGDTAMHEAGRLNRSSMFPAFCDFLRKDSLHFKHLQVVKNCLIFLRLDLNFRDVQSR